MSGINKLEQNLTSLEAFQHNRTESTRAEVNLETIRQEVDNLLNMKHIPLKDQQWIKAGVEVAANIISASRPLTKEDTLPMIEATFIVRFREMATLCREIGREREKELIEKLGLTPADSTRTKGLEQAATHQILKQIEELKKIMHDPEKSKALQEGLKGITEGLISILGSYSRRGAPSAKPTPVK